MSEPTGIERRRLKRVVVHRIPVTIQAGPLGGVGYVKNLSKEGVFIRTDLLPDAGETVNLVIHISGGREIEVTGKVCWTTKQVPAEEGTPAPGFGMHINPVPSDFLEFFEECLIS